MLRLWHASVHSTAPASFTNALYRAVTTETSQPTTGENEDLMDACCQTNWRKAWSIRFWNRPLNAISGAQMAIEALASLDWCNSRDPPTGIKISFMQLRSRLSGVVTLRPAAATPRPHQSVAGHQTNIQTDWKRDESRWDCDEQCEPESGVGSLGRDLVAICGRAPRLWETCQMQSPSRKKNSWDLVFNS